MCARLSKKLLLNVSRWMNIRWVCGSQKWRVIQILARNDTNRFDFNISVGNLNSWHLRSKEHFTISVFKLQKITIFSSWWNSHSCIMLRYEEVLQKFGKIKIKSLKIKALIHIKIIQTFVFYNKSWQCSFSIHFRKFRVKFYGHYE